MRAVVPRSGCYLDKSMRFVSARPIGLPVQAVLFAELADFYYYFLCKCMSVALLYACACQGPAGCQCEHALPPALLTWDPSCILCRHTKPWPQRSERPGHPLATMVTTGLFPSICLGCIPVLTPAPELLPVP